MEEGAPQLQGVNLSCPESTELAQLLAGDTDPPHPYARVVISLPPRAALAKFPVDGGVCKTLTWLRNHQQGLESKAVPLA